MYRLFLEARFSTQVVDEGLDMLRRLDKECESSLLRLR